MHRAAGLSCLAVIAFGAVCSARDDKPAIGADARPGKVKTLDDYFPWTPPARLEDWQQRQQELRAQLLVALGLWPMPAATPLNATIHGRIDREGYTIEKAFFASYPGHYVSGNLYRPKNKTGKLPGVLCPHGHWANGRFYDAGAAAAKQQIAIGAEKTEAGARYPLQARCAQLARMGCVVFHYDMVGEADSKPIKHRAGFTDAEAELRLQSFMGLQSYNSIRALDFLTSLPDVDSKRIGVTGASGGGTQTFILCGIDDRPTVAFPAVMVSTSMQGGCVCENCSYLRVGTGNIELAALFAPKPLGMSGAHDWTIDLETKGLPQLKQLYRLYGVEDQVMGRVYPQFEHNYNQVSRELMYNWFNKHLQLGLPEPVVERPFVPVPPRELSVYDAEHPRPADALDVRALRQSLTRASDAQLTALRAEKDQRQWREVMSTALKVMAGGGLPDASQIYVEANAPFERKSRYRWRRTTIGRRGAGDRIAAFEVADSKFDGTVVVWIHPRGKASLLEGGHLTPAARQILDRHAAILAPDVFGTGELTDGEPMPVDKRYAGFTFGYNRTCLANRVRAILTAVVYARAIEGCKKIDLLGIEEAGPWTLIARALCGDSVQRAAIDCHQFSFENVHETSDPMMFPGVLKYGGLPALVEYCHKAEMYLHDTHGTGIEACTKHEGLVVRAEREDSATIVDWLFRPGAR
jgi:hypothetical protein